MHLKQFVPSEVCLACDGCCRFKEEKSPWRPKMANEEIQQAVQGGLAEEIFSKAVAASGPIKTVSCSGHHFCSFFRPENNTCGIYRARPLECQLYPFVITRRGKDVVICAHHHCPFVQHQRHTQDFEEYVAYLKNFFVEPHVIEFLKRNPLLIGEYPDDQDDLEYLFPIEFNDRQSSLLSKKDLMEMFLKKENRHLSAFSFVSIFIWSEFFNFELELINGHLCIFADNDSGRFLYLPPLGKEGFSPQTIVQCFERMNRPGLPTAAARIENVTGPCLQRFSPEEFSFQPKAYEYVYFRKDIAALKGGGFKSKRSSYNFFVKNHSHEFLPYREEMLEEALSLYDRWARNRLAKYHDEIYAQMIQENRSVHRLALKYFKELGLVGRVVRVEGEIRGYSFGFPLNAQVFCVLFETTELTTQGLAVYLFRRFCDDPDVAPYPFINVMDDFGMKNIEAVKWSFRPAILLSSWVVAPKASQGRQPFPCPRHLLGDLINDV